MFICCFFCLAQPFRDQSDVDISTAISDNKSSILDHIALIDILKAEYTKKTSKTLDLPEYSQFAKYAVASEIAYPTSIDGSTSLSTPIADAVHSGGTETTHTTSFNIDTSMTTHTLDDADDDGFL